MRISEAAAAAMREGVCRFRKPFSSTGLWAPQAFRRRVGWDLSRGREEKGTGGPVMVWWGGQAVNEGERGR